MSNDVTQTKDYGSRAEMMSFKFGLCVSNLQIRFNLFRVHVSIFEIESETGRMLLIIFYI